MWAIDHSSMIMVILGGLYLGVKGAFGIDLAQNYLHSFENIVFVITGASAIWQFARQRFPV